MMNTTEKLPTFLEINQLVLDSMLEIMGPQDLSAVILSAALPAVLQDEKVSGTGLPGWDAWVRLAQTMLDRYGGPAAAGITIRVGQVLFKNFHRRFGSATLLESREFGMLPKPERIHNGLQYLAGLQSAYIPDHVVVIEQDAQHWYWKVERCKWCAQQPQLMDMLTKLMWGLMQEFLAWTGGGKHYPVHEQAASTEAGSAGTIAVQKKYID